MDKKVFDDKAQELELIYEIKKDKILERKRQSEEESLDDFFDVDDQG